MLRNELLEAGYHFEMIEPRKTIINLIWSGWVLLLMAPVMLVYLLIYAGDGELPLPYVDLPIVAINIMFIGMPALYFIIKEILISLFCFDKNRNINVKLHSSTDIPLNSQREAFKTWQLVIAHFIPPVFIYAVIFALGVMLGADMNLLVVIFIMAFLMSFDLSLVIYILFVKARYNANYIAVNSHVYSLTLYSKSYIRPKKRSDRIKKKLTHIHRTFEIPAKVKKVGISVILAGFLLSTGIYYFISPGEKEFNEAVPADPSDSYNIMDAVRISAYVSGGNAASLERLQMNEVRYIAPMSAADMEKSGFYLEFSRINEIVSRLDVFGEDMRLSDTRVPFNGVINVFPLSATAGKEYYLSVFAFRDEFSSYPRITAQIKLTVSEVNTKDLYSISIELVSYELTDTDKIMYGIDDDE